MTPSNDVWVLPQADGNRLAAFSDALMREGRRLSEEMGGALSAVLLGPDIGGLDETAGGHGVRHLYRRRDARLSEYHPDTYTAILSGLLRKYEPRLFLAVATSLGADLMPRLAAKIGAPLVTNCSDIQVGEGIAFTKAVQNGRLQATIKVAAAGEASATSLATLIPEALPEPDETVSTRRAEVREIEADVAAIPKRLHVREILKADPKSVDIREAEFVLAVGNGIGGEENFAVYEKFAALIGAALGGSRPVIDSRILSRERQIGQTGKSISPRLVILCGISGSEYFSRGIERAGTKIAINSDRAAPIFKDVDLGIVADVNALTPKFMAHLKRRARGGGR